MGFGGSVGWYFDRYVGSPFDINYGITFGPDGGYGLGSSNGFFVVIIMENVWFNW